MSPIIPLRPLSTLSDARLAELAGSGNERAFEALVRRYRRELLIYASRLVGAESRAEDVLQQALMRAWIALRDGTQVDELRPWLYRIVHNSAVTTLRRAQHDCVELNEALDAAAPEGGAESRLVLGELFAGIAAMPKPQREAILLTAVRGRSHGETAAMLGLTDGAVRGLVYRARASLRHAAAGLLPVGLINWIAAGGPRRAALAGDATDAAGAASSAGVAAVVLKGGMIVATAGVLAGAGQAVLPTSPGPRHHLRAAPHRVAGAISRSGAPRLALGGSGSLRAVSTSPAALERDQSQAGARLQQAARSDAGSHERRNGSGEGRPGLPGRDGGSGTSGGGGESSSGGGESSGGGSGVSSTGSGSNGGGSSDSSSGDTSGSSGDTSGSSGDTSTGSRDTSVASSDTSGSGSPGGTDGGSSGSTSGGDSSTSGGGTSSTSGGDSSTSGGGDSGTSDGAPAVPNPPPPPAPS